jgi:hypothetical protein
VLAAFFFYEDDRLKFRAIITMEIFNTIRSAVFSLSLSRSARVACEIAPFEAKSSSRKADLMLTDAVFSFFFLSFKYSFIPYQ